MSKDPQVRKLPESVLAQLKWPIPHMELMYDDVKDQMEDVTVSEMQVIAESISDSLMDMWSDALEIGITKVEGYRWEDKKSKRKLFRRKSRTI